MDVEQSNDRGRCTWEAFRASDVPGQWLTLKTIAVYGAPVELLIYAFRTEHPNGIEGYYGLSLKLRPRRWATPISRMAKAFLSAISWPEVSPMRRRIEKVFNNVRERPDAIILKNSTYPHIDANFFYVTGYASGIFEESIAVLRPDLSLDIITTPLEEETARRGREMEISTFKTKREQMEILRKKLGRTKKIGIDMAELVSSDYAALKRSIPAKFMDVSNAFGRARMLKGPDEIALIGAAAKIASRALEDPGGLIRPGKREGELAAELNYRMQKGGASNAAFETIVAFGPNSAEPHHSPGKRRARRGEFVLIDMGAAYMRYCSDITRTYVPGQSSGKQKEMFQTVLRAREAALKAVREGVNGKDVHRAAQGEIDRTKFKGRFTHGLGHGLGLTTHDSGRLAPTADLSLQRGMIFTIEPGIYLPGYGGVRVEDDILVTKNGYKLLTKALITLEI
jgi:Xaa-Pro dipeptidase